MTYGRIAAVALDCYRTLVRVTRPRGIARTMARLSGGRIDPSPMTVDEPLGALLRLAATAAPEQDLASFDEALADEIASITPLTGAHETIDLLKGHDLRIAIASNLAQDYGRTIVGMFAVDVLAFSYELGVTKPDAVFYERLCGFLDALPDQVLMVGDTFASDYAGATAAGLHAVHLWTPPRADVAAIETIADLPAWMAERFT